MIQDALKVFILEDRSTDVELTKRSVKRFVPNAVFTVAMNKAEFLERIEWNEYDVILADYHLPDYNGLTALLYVREHMPEVPFIFVTGMLNDEQKSAEAILNGANGYVLKENLGQLEASVTDSLTVAANQRREAKLAADKQQKRAMTLQKLYYTVEAADFGEKEIVLEDLRTLIKEG